MKYKRKYQEVTALEWDGTHAGMQKIKAIFPTLQTAQISMSKDGLNILYWSIRTPEGEKLVNRYNFVVQADGDYFVIKRDSFNKTYEII